MRRILSKLLGLSQTPLGDDLDRLALVLRDRFPDVSAVISYRVGGLFDVRRELRTPDGEWLAEVVHCRRTGKFYTVTRQEIVP